MSKIIAFTNQKGGVGKTTSSQCFGLGLIEQGKKVLFVDLDQQCSLSLVLGVPKGTEPNVYDVLLGEVQIKKAIHKMPKFDVLPASPSLTNADKVITEVGKEFRLKEAIDPIRHDYDFIILDCPPNLGILTIIALAAADEVIIPTQASILEFSSVEEFGKTFKIVKKYVNPSLTLSGLLLCKHNPRTTLAKELGELTRDMAEEMGTKLFETTIRSSIKMNEAQTLKENLFHYAPNSTVAQDYTDFVNEYLKGEKR